MEFLEIASTLHCLKHDENVKDSDSVNVLMSQNGGRFTNINKCKRVFKEMKKWNII